MLNILNPKAINTIGFFLQSPLPDTLTGGRLHVLMYVLAGIYYSIPPYEGLQFLGAIANVRPRYNIYIYIYKY